MTYIPVTPFRRAVDSVVLEHMRVDDKVVPIAQANKWEVLRELSVARRAFSLTDRDMAVLQALFSFHPEVELGVGEAVVFPSNRAICERLNGMACSTMRRHLSNLVASGLVVRRDSPNGKRYSRVRGGAREAFGFDLSPLVRRFEEICEIAETVRAEQEQFARLRTTVSLMRRDLAGLAEYGTETQPDVRVWDRLSDLAALTGRDLRRKLDMEALVALESVLRAALDEAKALCDAPVSENMSTKESRNEQHHQNSNKDSYDFEPCLESTGREVVRRVPETPTTTPGPAVPLALVLACCREILTYAEGPIRDWRDLVRAVDRVRPMMGISPSAWSAAQHAMGPEAAAIVVAAMLERFTEIKSPGGYLRALTAKAAAGAFSCGPMVMALRNKAAA